MIIVITTDGESPTKTALDEFSKECGADVWECIGCPTGDYRLAKVEQEQLAEDIQVLIQRQYGKKP